MAITEHEKQIEEEKISLVAKTLWHLLENNDPEKDSLFRSLAAKTLSLVQTEADSGQLSNQNQESNQL